MAGLHQRLLRLATLPDWTVRLACALASGAFALRGFALFDESRANFDQALAWYAIALAFAVAFAWDGFFPAGEWTRRFAAFVRVHWVEGAFLTGILAFATFLRLYRFGDYPPADLFCCADGELWRLGEDVLDGGRRSSSRSFTTRPPSASLCSARIRRGCAYHPSSSAS